MGYNTTDSEQEESIADAMIPTTDNDHHDTIYHHTNSDGTQIGAYNHDKGQAAVTNATLKKLNISKPLNLHHNTTCTITGIPLSRSLIPRRWMEMLQNYPDRQWAYRLVHDIIYGVDIGFIGVRLQTVTGTTRKTSTDRTQSAAIDQDIEKELKAKRIIGPYAKSPWKHYHSSPIFTVSKKGNPGKLRVVHHLSYPRNRNLSVNDWIKDWPCVLGRFNQAVKMVCELDRDCYMAKMDIKAAYRLIAVRPADWPLLAFTWREKIYFHTTLPFGLRSSCHIWERYATAANWMLNHELSTRRVMHYVDDWFMAAETAAECEAMMGRVEQLFGELGLTIATEKTVGPTTRMVFLGIQIDSEAMTISLDEERVAAISKLLETWQLNSNCSLQQLQSLIGTLSFAACVVAHGRTFIEQLRALEQQHRQIADRDDESLITITNECRQDVEWWHSFLHRWNGISLLWETEWLDEHDSLQPHSDACTEGYGAVCGTQWFHRRWTEEQQQWSEEGTSSRESMPFKELYALVTAAATWGHLWQRKRITFRTDCMPVVLALNKGTSRSRRMMQLIRFLHYHAARHHYKYRAVHIPGVDNTIADELSRVHSLSQLSQACRQSIDPSETTPVLPTIPL